MSLRGGDEPVEVEVGAVTSAGVVSVVAVLGVSVVTVVAVLVDVVVAIVLVDSLVVGSVGVVAAGSVAVVEAWARLATAAPLPKRATVAIVAVMVRSAM